MAGLSASGSIHYEATISARVCACTQAPTSYGRSADLDRLIARFRGYYNVYLAFFGDQLVWLNFDIADVHTGQIVWRNGRLTTGSDHGTLDKQG